MGGHWSVLDWSSAVHGRWQEVPPHGRSLRHNGRVSRVSLASSFVPHSESSSFRTDWQTIPPVSKGPRRVTWLLGLWPTPAIGGDPVGSCTACYRADLCDRLSEQPVSRVGVSRTVARRAFGRSH